MAQAPPPTPVDNFGAPPGPEREPGFGQTFCEACKGTGYDEGWFKSIYLCLCFCSDKCPYCSGKGLDPTYSQQVQEANAVDRYGYTGGEPVKNPV
eukprot:CAMPEP_0174303356 /NCGR_PEP_ID=MMETSP0809-20121228/60139_1 /TAXON_ID=73025 ORGANISM="Eutreptiella gymnastica-like, Strain CCMP1594" /NCGR_SAMPLE_ID=MMETSP0809 /ASSEMBLY_ACC=CAM_ASM_000658 /LENGTH=94 /DNA_ID=CAMNT_0015409371 /DNA_START=43 /DNA_END=327 /DNA_ORIENTATION=+